MNRRTFVSLPAAAAAANAAGASNIPIIDAHIHLFDPTRPGGVPWPPKENTVLYKPALPERYKKLSVPLGIKGAIKVEASPLVEDNAWVLAVAEKDPIMVGVIGNIEPGTPDFEKNLDRFRKSPLFLGIRYGTLWDRNFHKALDNPKVIADLKLLAKAGLTMDTATPTPPHVADLVRMVSLVPDLRLVIDHLPQTTPPTDAAENKKYEANLKTLAARPNVYVKISEVLRKVDGKIPQDLAFYKPRLDQLTGIFGEDRVLFGSDWPNSENWASYGEVFKIVHDYFLAKGPAAAEKYFWKNSVKAYRWKRRDPSQPDPSKA